MNPSDMTALPDLLHGRSGGRRGAGSFAESLSYFTAGTGADGGPERYLSLVKRAAAAVEIPVIASLNGATTGGWTDYASSLLDAGAAAIELNTYYLPGGPPPSSSLLISGSEVEQRHVEILTKVKAVVSVPVAVKLSPYFSSTGEMARRWTGPGPTAWYCSTGSCSPTSTPRR